MRLCAVASWSAEGGVQGSWPSKAENTLPAPKPIVNASGGNVSKHMHCGLHQGCRWNMEDSAFIGITLRAQL